MSPFSPKAVFDMSRTNSVVSSTGLVHITKHHGANTLCGIILADGLRTRDDWSENYEDKQPTCRNCLNLAPSWPSEARITQWVRFLIK